ncbi:hypothetical protein SYNPS1DRAFT_27588 [Syncephalis pseudoplumigaleata]|uniref:Uncharacterized protein n=1 Tax=Syncephalis pseudoplumigaleata TaxID=1712513 RepID=A0A4V1J1Z0_9FUNG|nr:hypothetical protein SYNPS1DRAFT_27588 [Syncephalis pseudoplumigaleata]|eukprot:RKP26729.1 hypothetical protein SYNPS1DRAFT_27588 [Syncephalis pseudoplumigaleata]
MRFQPLVLNTRQVVTLAQSIWFKYHAETSWFARILESLSVSLDEHAAELMDPMKARQKIQVFAHLIGCLMREDLSLRQQLQQWMIERFTADPSKLASAEHRQWRLLLLLMLVARDNIDLIAGLEHIIAPLLAPIGNDPSQNWDKTLTADVLHWLSAVLLQASSALVQLSMEEALHLTTRLCTGIECLAQCRPVLALLVPLVQLEMGLPLSDALRHQCHDLRHQLLGASWFKQACLKDPMAFAHYLVEQRATAPQESHALVLQSGLTMAGAPEHEHAPDETYFLNAFSYALSHLSPWNLAYHRAIIYLALTGLGYDARKEQQQQQHNGNSMEEEKVMDVDAMDGHADIVPTSPSHGSSVACAFFDAMVLQSSTDLQLLHAIIPDLPIQVLQLFISHGQQLLEAPMASFPANFLVFSGLIDNAAMLTASLERMYTIMLMLLARADVLRDTMEKSLEQMACSLLTQLQRLVSHAKVAIDDDGVQVAQVQRGGGIVRAGSDGIGGGTDQLRLCMELRLRLIVPLLPRLLDHPQACATDNWIVTLLELLTNPIMTDTSHFGVLGHDGQSDAGPSESLFEFTLDMLSFLLDGEHRMHCFTCLFAYDVLEIPNDIRKHVLGTMRTMEMQLDLPQVYAERIRRILPFKVSYAYQRTTPAELVPLLDPWRWLEDTPVIMGRHMASVSTPAPFTPNTGGVVSTPGTGDDAVIVPIKPDTRNDTPLSLALFSARRLQRVDSALVGAIQGGQVVAGWSCPAAMATSPSMQHSDGGEQDGGHRSKRTSPEPGELAAESEMASMRQKRAAEDELPDI